MNAPACIDALRLSIDGLVNEPRFLPPGMRLNSFGELEIYGSMAGPVTRAMLGTDWPMSVWAKAPSRVEILFRARATDQARNRWLGRAHEQRCFEEQMRLRGAA